MVSGRATASPTRAAASRRRWRDVPWALLFLGPNLVLFLVFTTFPILFGVVISFANWDIVEPMTFAGLANYQKLLFGDPLVWKWLYAYQFGAVNSLIAVLKIPRHDWLFDQNLVMPAIIIVAIWAALPVQIIFFLAGLQGVPADLYEAAAIDGAGRWQQFAYVTWPMLTPTTFFLLIITLIGSMTGGFDIVWNLTQGGPLDASNLFIVQLFRTAFVYFQMGYASAMAYALFLAVLVVTIIQWRTQAKWVHYS